MHDGLCHCKREVGAPIAQKSEAQRHEPANENAAFRQPKDARGTV